MTHGLTEFILKAVFFAFIIEKRYVPGTLNKLHAFTFPSATEQFNRLIVGNPSQEKATLVGSVTVIVQPSKDNTLS
jgi:hypothetical protein